MKRLLYVLAIVPVLLFGCSDFESDENYEITTPSWMWGTWTLSPEDDTVVNNGTEITFTISQHEIYYYSITHSATGPDTVLSFYFTEIFSIASETETDAAYTLDVIYQEYEDSYTWTRTDSTDTLYIDIPGMIIPLRYTRSN